MSENTDTKTGLYYINTAFESDTRFDFAKFMRWEHDCYDPITSKFLVELMDMKPDGQFIIQTEEQRPDLISYKIYGSTQYWWIIMMYNSIIDIEALVSELVLLYPSLDDLENSYFSLKSQSEA